MAHLIQKEHEIICSGCGCVLKEVEDTLPEMIQKSPNPPSVDIFLLGTAIERNIKLDSRRDPKQLFEERTLRKLVDITKEFSLPDSLAYDTLNELKRKRSGFRSEIEPIKQLIKILSKDDNYLYYKKMKAIKVRYEELLNH